MERVVRRGPLARAPGALKRKKILEKKVSQYRKTERGPFGVFQHLFCRKRSKIEGRTLWEKNFPKNERGSRPVWYVTRENRKNLFGSVR